MTNLTKKKKERKLLTEVCTFFCQLKKEIMVSNMKFWATLLILQAAKKMLFLKKGPQWKDSWNRWLLGLSLLSQDGEHCTLLVFSFYHNMLKGFAVIWTVSPSLPLCAFDLISKYYYDLALFNWSLFYGEVFESNRKIRLMCNTSSWLNLIVTR